MGLLGQGLLYVVLWFPLLREITTKYIRSLYITIGFLQFLGIFSQFNIDWSRADCDLGYLLRWMPFFSLNIADTIHFSCAGSGSAFGYRAQWIVQMLLPMCYPAYCVASIASEICIGALARRHLPPTQVLLQVGWRPRRDFSVKALLNAYLPAGIFFLNMYYNTAISTAFSMLVCIKDGANDRHFLRADPNVTCWEGDHVWFSLAAVVGVVVYLIGVPALFAHVLFWRIPASGLSNQRTLALFGFLYTRFEPKVWYWELVEMLRKVMFVIAAQLGHKLDPSTQCILALAAVSSVTILNFVHKPFKDRAYNMLSFVTSVTELVCIVLGMGILSYIKNFSKTVDAGAKLTWVWFVGWCFLSASLAAIVMTAASDMLTLHRQRRARLVSNRTSCVLSSKLFDLNYDNSLLVRVLSVATKDEIRLFRTVDALLLQPCLLVQNSIEVQSYAARVKADPFLIDVTASDVGEKPRTLAAYLRGSRELRRQLGTPSAHFFAHAQTGQLLRWLSEEASDSQRLLLAAFFETVRKRRLELYDNMGRFDKMYNVWYHRCLGWYLGGSLRHSMFVPTIRAESRGWVFLRHLYRTDRLSSALREALTARVATAELREMMKRLAAHLVCEAVVMVPCNSASIRLPTLVADGPEVNPRVNLNRRASIDHPDWSLTKTSPGGLAVTNRGAVVVDDNLSDSRFTPDAMSEDTISQLCVPIFALPHVSRHLD